MNLMTRLAAISTTAVLGLGVVVGVVPAAHASDCATQQARVTRLQRIVNHDRAAHSANLARDKRALARARAALGACRSASSGSGVGFAVGYS